MEIKTALLTAVLCALLIALAVPQVHAGSATWSPAPGSGDWNTAGNWLPMNVPNGSADIATFDVSTRTAISFSANTEVNGITFNPTASAYSFTETPTFTLTLSGAGITNNSGVMQTFLAPTDGSGNLGTLLFKNSATAGTQTLFTLNGASLSGHSGGTTVFQNTSTAGSSAFILNGGAVGGGLAFINTSTAGNGTFTANGSLTANSSNSSGGRIDFGTDANPGNGTFFINGGTVSGGRGGYLHFGDINNSASPGNAANCTVTTNGGSANGAFGGTTQFFFRFSAGNGTFTTNGGTASGAFGGTTLFGDNTTAGNATLIANGGTNGGNGGVILFLGNPIGGTARVEVFDNAKLEIAFENAPGVTIGSLEGNGNVSLGSNNLTVGSNNASTSFSGLIQDNGTSGTFAKIGAGTLTLSGANTYAGGTTVVVGTLLVSNTTGSGTGSGAVAVNGGMLGGTSSGITGAVTVASGGALNAGTSAFSQGVMFLNAPGTALNLQNNSTFHFDLQGTNPGNGAALYDQINITNDATLGGNVTGSIVTGFTPSQSSVYYVLTIGGVRTGIFANATEGATLDLGNGFIGQITYQANWTGTQAGSSLSGGNDVAIFNIRAVPEPSTYLMLLGGVGMLLCLERTRSQRKRRL